METSLSEALGETPEKEAVANSQPEPAEAPEPVEKPAEAEAQPEKPESATVPLAALLAERDEARELKRRLAALEAANQPKPEPVPDVLDDPEKFAAYVQRSQQEALAAERLNISEEMARMTYGDEAVDAAFAAFQPHMGTAKHGEIMQSRNPYKSLVDWHKQQQVMSEIGSDPVAYRTKLEAEIRAKVEAEIAARQVKGGVKPPPSLAAESNLGARTGPAWSGPAPLSQLLGE